jgi:uncharacterized protein (UPF0335 family)
MSEAGSNGIEAGPLRAFIERIENVEMTIREDQVGRKEIYEEAKSSGYDARIIRKIVALRRKAASARIAKIPLPLSR